MAKMKISPPWIQYVNKLRALFGRDEEIKINYNNDDVEVKLMVENSEKANALTQLLPTSVNFGNVVLKVTVVPANCKGAYKDLFEIAFDGNPAFKYMETVDNVFTNPISYVVFAKEVVQYYNDDMSDIHGVRSTLYETLAEEIFEGAQGIYFCTDTDGNEAKTATPKEPKNKYQATDEEIALWEKYNGKGSFNDGSPIKDDKNTKKWNRK